VQSLILVRRRGWSGRIASLPLFRVSFFFPSFFCLIRLTYKSRRRMKFYRSTLIRRGNMKCSFCMQYDDVITYPRWKTDAILKIVFWLYLGAILADQREIWNRDEGSHADIGHVTKTAIFANSRWRTATILKIALSPYLSRELTDFGQIWYTNFHSEHASLTETENFQIQYGGRTPYLKSFLAISQCHIGRFMQISEWR